jgi:hypothetical protein
VIIFDDVKFPIPKPLAILHTIAHEYKHALQRFGGDHGKSSDDDPREDDARAFEVPTVDKFLATWKEPMPARGEISESLNL